MALTAFLRSRLMVQCHLRGYKVKISLLLLKCNNVFFNVIWLTMSGIFLDSCYLKHHKVNSKVKLGQTTWLWIQIIRDTFLMWFLIPFWCICYCWSSKYLLYFARKKILFKMAWIMKIVSEMNFPVKNIRKRGITLYPSCISYKKAYLSLKTRYLLIWPCNLSFDLEMSSNHQNSTTSWFFSQKHIKKRYYACCYL